MTIQEIDENLEEGQSLKSIAQAYSEIANLKIKTIRAQVERNRLFFEEISKVYGIIRRMAAKKGLTIKKPKQLAVILITSNYHFYGNINSDLIKFFNQNPQVINADRILIGRAALNFFKARNLLKNYHSFLLKRDIPNLQELNSLIDLIKNYSQVLIIHSRLKSLLIQEPVITDITPSAKTLAETEAYFRFIFEPELPKIISFFDSQILTLLLESTFLESELSRTASRFISMDRAETEANKFIKDYEKLKALTQKSITNDKILENYAAQIATEKENDG